MNIPTLMGLASYFLWDQGIQWSPLSMTENKTYIQHSKSSSTTPWMRTYKKQNYQLQIHWHIIPETNDHLVLSSSRDSQVSHPLKCYQNRFHSLTFYRKQAGVSLSKTQGTRNNNQRHIAPWQAQQHSNIFAHLFLLPRTEIPPIPQRKSILHSKVSFNLCSFPLTNKTSLS